jgi:hypothetical protein
MTRVHTGADVKKQFKPLLEADVYALSDEASFRKGYDAYLQHSIVEPTLSASVLSAFCSGSSGSSQDLAQNHWDLTQNQPRWSSRQEWLPAQSHLTCERMGSS